MGERKCAFEGCSALEFRTSGFCLRHKENHSEKKIQNENSMKSNLEPENIDDRPSSLGFMKGFFYSPFCLAMASLFLQDVCSVWLFFGVIIPPLSYLNGRSQFSMGFAIGSIVGVLVFIIPWISFTLGTDLICYDVVWSSNC